MCQQKSYGDQGLWEIFILKPEVNYFIQKVLLEQALLIPVQCPTPCLHCKPTLCPCHWQGLGLKLPVNEWNQIQLLKVPSISVYLSFHPFPYWQNPCPWATKLLEWYKTHNNNPSLWTLRAFFLYINSIVHQLKGLNYDYETFIFHKILKVQKASHNTYCQCPASNVPTAIFICLHSTWTHWNLLICWKLTALEETEVSFGFTKSICSFLFPKEVFTPLVPKSPKLCALESVFPELSYYLTFNYCPCWDTENPLGLRWSVFSWSLSVVWRPQFSQSAFKSHNICTSLKDLLLEASCSDVCLLMSPK